MQNQRRNVIGRFGSTPGRLAIGLLAASVTACVGCSQPKSFLDTTAMQQQSRDAERFWGPDALVGQAPLAHHAPDVARGPAPSLLAQNGADASRDLFPATYRSVTLPRSQRASMGGTDYAVVRAQPTPSRLPEPVMTTAYEPAKAAVPQVSEPKAGTVTYVAGRPRDDGLMMTPLDESDSLPPLPTDTSTPQPLPRIEASPTADSDALPPLPSGME